jgi:hypothetical protein
MGFYSKLRLARKKIKAGRPEGSGGAPSLTISPPALGGPANSLTTTSTGQYPRQSMLSVPQPPNPTPAAMCSLSQPAAFAPLTLSDDFELWTRAYKIFQTREPGLMDDYKKHLTSQQYNGTTDADLSTAQSVESIVKQLLDNREKKQWQVSLFGKEIKIREQAERLAKFLIWSDPIVKSALSAQPYAALAWSGVSLLLPVGI